MSVLDIVLLCCFLPAVIQGLMKGFIKQAVGIVALVAGVWAAFNFSAMAAERLSEYMTMEKNVIHTISFAIIAIVTIVLLNLFGELVTKIVNLASLGWINRFLGLLFGIIKVALIIGLLISVFEPLNAKWAFVAEEKLDSSVVYDALRHFAGVVFPFIKDFLSNIQNV